MHRHASRNMEDTVINVLKKASDCYYNSENYYEATQRVLYKIYEKLEYKIKYGRPEKKDLVDIEKARQMKIALEKQINSIPKILQGGYMNKEEAFAEAKQLCKIDFLA